MAGDPQFGPAPDFGAPLRATTPHLPRDPVALREAVEAALAAGEPAGRVYARVVRPALGDGRRAVARSAAHAALAALAGALPASDEGLGRRACVLRPGGAVGELDARALADVLEAAGWSVTEIPLTAQEPAVTVDLVVEARVELALVPVADAAQILAAQLPLALLRRVTAPPLIVGATFEDGAGTDAVAADHVVGSMDDLPALLRRRLGSVGGGHGGASAVPWGVHLNRDETGGLVVAPVGLLDAVSVDRLREIVETRRGLYSSIVIDLRELLATDPTGLSALVSWHTEQPWPPTVSTISDPRLLSDLTSAGLTGTLPLSS